MFGVIFRWWVYYPWFMISIFCCPWWKSKKWYRQYHWVSFATQVVSFCMANFNFGPVVISEANTDPFRYVKPLPRGEIRERIFRSYVYLPKRQFGVAFLLSNANTSNNRIYIKPLAHIQQYCFGIFVRCTRIPYPLCMDYLITCVIHTA